MQLIDHQFSQRIGHWIDECIKPYSLRWQRESRWPIRELVKSLFSSNLSCAGWPAPYGDGDLRKQLYLHYSLAREAPGSVGLCIASHVDIGARCLLEKANPHLTDQWLRPALRGDVLLALAMTEPHAGSDLQGIEFRAAKVENGWSLSGTKRGITNLPFADAVIVLARTAPGRSPFSYSLFLLPMNTHGVARESALPTLGYADCLGGMRAEDALVPEENLLGSPGAGLILLMQHLAIERLFVSARMRGISELLLEKICKHSVSHPEMVADLVIQCEAFNAYFEQCIENYIRQEFPAKESASLKYLGCRLLKTLTEKLCELDGATAYMKSGLAEIYQREAIGLSLAGGSEEIMLAIIGSEL